MMALTTNRPMLPKTFPICLVTALTFKATISIAALAGTYVHRRQGEPIMRQGAASRVPAVF
jgi:hypothetical protein